MNILDLMNNDFIKSQAEKLGLDANQLTDIAQSALPLLQNGGDINSIAATISEKTGISPDQIQSVLTQFAPQIQELLGDGNGLGNLLGGFLGGDKKEGGLTDLLGNFFGK